MPPDFKDPYAAERAGPNELTRQYPEVSGFLQALLGAAPDEVGGSVLDPNRARLMSGAKYGFPLGTALAVAPALGPLSRLAASGARAGARNLAVPSTLSRQAGVIKAPGGNWLSGSIESALSRLKQPLREDAYLAQIRADEARGDMIPGIYEDTVAQNAKSAALNTWVDKQLRNYVRNEMATPGDPIRALAERGVLHYEPNLGLYNVEQKHLQSLRGESGFPPKGLAKSKEAKAWEKLTDSDIMTWKPSDLGAYTHGGPSLEGNEFLAKLPEETRLYALGRLGSNRDSSKFGFNHLIDELRNATNPESGLPAELLLKYSSLPQVSVPQAVERVAKINAWREAQKIAADQARANNAATVLHKEYPDKGFKWVELRKPDDLPEGWAEGRANMVTGEPQYFNTSDPETLTRTNPAVNTLADALKYEGDTLGHCVGRYCPDVLEGRSRIFSLRDAKGQPHTTIEVQPGKGDPVSDKFRELDPETIAEINSAARAKDTRGVDWGKQGEFLPGDEADIRRHYVRQATLERFPEWVDLKVPDRIVQIKGKVNRAPNPEYLPYVQDFVKSGTWSDVGEARNAGLRKFTDVFNSKELRSLQEAGAELPNSGWLTGEDIQNLHNMITPEGKRLQYDASGNIVGGFAAGGIVASGNSGYNPDRVEEILSQLRAEMQ